MRVAGDDLGRGRWGPSGGRADGDDGGPDGTDRCGGQGTVLPDGDRSQGGVGGTEQSVEFPVGAGRGGQREQPVLPTGDRRGVVVIEGESDDVVDGGAHLCGGDPGWIGWPGPHLDDVPGICGVRWVGDDRDRSHPGPERRAEPGGVASHGEVGDGAIRFEVDVDGADVVVVGQPVFQPIAEFRQSEAAREQQRRPREGLFDIVGDGIVARDVIDVGGELDGDETADGADEPTDLAVDGAGTSDGGSTAIEAVADPDTQRDEECGRRERGAVVGHRSQRQGRGLAGDDVAEDAFDVEVQGNHGEAHEEGQAGGDAFTEVPPVDEGGGDSERERDDGKPGDLEGSEQWVGDRDHGHLATSMNRVTAWRGPATNTSSPGSMRASPDGPNVQAPSWRTAMTATPWVSRTSASLRVLPPKGPSLPTVNRWSRPPARRSTAASSNSRCVPCAVTTKAP